MAHAFRYLNIAIERPWRNRVAATLFGFVVWLCALTPTSIVEAAENPSIQVVRFTVFGTKPISDVSFTPRPNAAAQKLVFHSTARSPRYEYRGTMPMRFLDAAGVVVAEANIPPGIRDPLLLFLPAESGGKGNPSLRYQIAVLDDSATRHGPGGLAMLNLSGLSLNGTVDSEKVTLKAGLNPTLAMGRSAKVTLNTTFKNKTYQSYSATVSLGRNERALLILLPPFYPGALEVQSRLLLDQPPAAAPAMR